MRRAAAVPVLLLVGVAATGWMYLLHPALPGPRIGLALPLDELSRHSSVSLLWYLIVWGVAAALLGAYAIWNVLDAVPWPRLQALPAGYGQPL